MSTTLLTLRERLQTSLGDKKLIYADYYTDAINEASREIYPILHKRVDYRQLISDNILPNAHFQDWASTSYPDFYSLSNGTGTATTTSGLYRGGAKSAKVTAGTAADGYMYVSSNSYPRLLDLMGQEIDFKAWAYPEVADDAFLTIYTLQANGTTQTLNSTTTCPAGKWTLLALEDQSINDDIVQIDFRFRVHTTAKYAYFDNARAIGDSLYELLLPSDLQKGHLSQAWLQSSSYSDDPCDDINPKFDNQLFDWFISEDAGYKYLKPNETLSSAYLLELVGYSPLENLTADTDTITLEDPKINLLIALAKYKLYQMVESIPAADDTSRYERASARAYNEYLRLIPGNRMSIPSETIRIK